MNTTKCKVCGKEIFFVKTDNGKLMPFDVKKTKFYFEESFAKPRILDGCVTHFATCPNYKNQRCNMYDGDLEEIEILKDTNQVKFILFDGDRRFSFIIGKDVLVEFLNKVCVNGGG